MTGERTGYRGVVITGTACASMVLLGTCMHRCHGGGGSGDSASAEKEILERSRTNSEAIPASSGLASSSSTSIEELRAHRAELAKLPLTDRVKRAKASCAADGCPNDTTDDLLAASKNDSERDAISKAMAPFNAPAAGREAKARAILALVRNPRAVKPSQVTPPDQDEPDHTTYEYSGVPGLGDVILQSYSASRWSLALPGETSPELFASDDQIENLDRIGPDAWWRITGGPLAGDFVLRTAVLEIRSREDACRSLPTRNDPAPLRSAACARAH